MTNLDDKIKEQNNEKLKEIKGKKKIEKRAKRNAIIGSFLTNVASLFFGRNKVEYKTFLKLHNDSKIGTFEKGSTKIGEDVGVVYTEQGPIIQTSTTDIYSNRPKRLINVEVKALEKGRDANLVYEGFFKNYEGVWLYAKVGKVEDWKEDSQGIHAGEYKYNIILRDENGKFISLFNNKSDDHIIIKGRKYPCAQKIYYDLSKRFETELQKLINKKTEL